MCSLKGVFHLSIDVKEKKKEKNYIIYLKCSVV